MSDQCGGTPPIVNLQGRRVLIVSPSFFGYERRIIERLESRGAQAVFVDDRPSNSTLSKVLIRLGPRLVQSKLDAYHRATILRFQGNKFDDILFISPESCSVETIRRYRASFPDARVMLYMWDSFENKRQKDVPDFLRLFDKAFSFDGQDCEKYAMHFRPLFFCGPATEGGPEPRKETYVFSFIGTIHSDRYKILKLLENQVSRLGKTCFIYPYLPSGLHYWLFKLTRREFRGVRKADFRFLPLPYADVLQVMRHSAAMVDIEHPDQRGLTMRTLEVIGSGRKLITTNRNVVNYPFFSPERIQVIDRNAPQILPAFLESTVGLLPAGTLAPYSLDGWLDDLFSVGAENG